jgi:putative RecB family exonuclease
MRGIIPKRLQLIYLANAETLTYDPDEQDLLATERKVQAIWEAVRLAQESGDWQPSPGPLCRWCSHQALCPAYGGTPPPLPVAQEPTDSSSGSSG